MFGFQWTGHAPEGLDSVPPAEALDARWEGVELVTYDLPALHHRFEHYGDEWGADPH
jgi:hypothetical protein